MLESNTKEELQPLEYHYSITSFELKLLLRINELTERVNRLEEEEEEE